MSLHYLSPMLLLTHVPAPTIFVRGLAGCVTVALVRVVATGRRGRRPLRLVCCRTPSVAVGGVRIRGRRIEVDAPYVTLSRWI